jgi:hypothetical protein
MNILEQINKAIEQYELENNIVMSDEERKAFADRIFTGLGLNNDEQK